MNLRDVEVFLAVVDEGTFAGAARRLRLGRATVTERMAALERDVGDALFERSPTRPTAVGITFEPYARRIVGQVTAGLTAVSEVRRGGRTGLRVGFLGNAAVEMNVPLFRALRRALPEARISLTEIPLADIESSVIDGRVDVAILRSPIGEPSLCSVPLFWAPRVAVVAADGPFGGATSLSVEDLADATFTGVSGRNSATFRDFFLLVSERNGVPPAKFLPSYTLSDSGMHILTQGAVATPTSEVLRVFPMPGVAIVPLVGAPPSAAIAVCRREDQRPAVRAFMDIAMHIAVTCAALIPDAVPPPVT